MTTKHTPEPGSYVPPKVGDVDAWELMQAAVALAKGGTE